MLEPRGESRRRTRIALAASLALHLALAALLPTLVAIDAQRQSVAAVTILTQSAVAQIEIAHSKPKAARKQAPAVRPHRILATIPPARPAPARQHARLASRPLAAAASPAPAEQAATAQSPAPSATAVASAAPQAPAAAAGSAVREVAGMPPFGTHESSPVLDALTQRRLKALGLNVTLTVRVDSNGKVLTLAFSPPVDPQTRARVVAMLAKASWDPAVCGGGLPCAGKATIRI